LNESAVTTRVEKKQVEERVAIGASVVYEAIRREGDEELKRPTAALAWSGLAAGLSMGFSMLAEALLAAHLPDRLWRPLIASLGYSVGFLIVILGRQQLFTENTLTVILSLPLRKNVTLGLHVLRLWAVVLSANLFGTFLFALVVAQTKLFEPAVQQAMMDIGSAHRWAAVPDGIYSSNFCGMVDRPNGLAVARSRCIANFNRYYSDVHSWLG
jgi:formate/nitrite transporter FocA (FNT family)